MSKLLEQINSFQKYQVRLGDLLDVRDGTHDTPQRQSQGYQLITSKQIKGGKIDQTDYLISEDDFNEVNKRSKVDQWDILVSMIGTVGEVLLIKEEPSFAIKNIGLLKTNKNEFLARYIYYCLTSLVGQNEIRANLSGTSQQFISLGRLRDIEINIPKKESDQKKIASILSAYDAKIENNNKIIKSLETIAQTIFNEWFVNFKFPGYEKVKMVESEMGEIPEGWKVGKVSDFGNIICGKTPSKSNPDFFGGNIPFIKIPDMHGQMFIVNTEDSLTEKGANTQINKLVPEGSICVSCIATVGLVSITTKDSQTNQQINTVVPEDKKFMEYLYFTLIDMKADLQAIGSGGSTTLNVNTSVFSNIEVVIPNKDILEKFHIVVMPMFDGVRHMINENISLKSQRDQLLAKLI